MTHRKRLALCVALFVAFSAGAGAWTLDHVLMGHGAAGETHDVVPDGLTEADKLAQARAAVDAAERAGTRRITPTSSPERVFGADAEAAKRQRLREIEPTSAESTPGVPDHRIAEGGTR